MVKWTYLVGAVAWIASMIYEWMWSGGDIGGYIAGAVVGVTVLAGLFIRGITAEVQTKRQDPPPMIWFVLAALAVSLLYSMLERTANGTLTHVPMLPLYLILFLDFFVSGCYTWWKKLRSKYKR